MTTIQYVQISLDPTSGRPMVARADPIIICPLDSNHRIESSQLQCHLERCLIGDLVKMTCPWNPLHDVDESSYKYHIDVCEDKPLPKPEKEDVETSTNS